MPLQLDFFLLPLLGGFVFIRCFRLTQYPTSRLSGQRLILWAAIASIILIFLSGVTVTLLTQYLPQVSTWLGGWSIEIFPFPHSYTAFGAFLIGCVAWWPANHFWSEEKALKWTIERYGSKVEILFAESIENKKQIQVTLANGKVFVGYISWQPIAPHKDNSYIGLLPTLSGYRDTNSKQVIFVTDYASIYETIDEYKDKRDFIKYFSMSEIRIASVFDPDVYKNWKR